MLCGISHDEFLDLTPAECFERIVSFQEREELIEQRAMRQAWYVARMERAKHIPSLEALLGKETPHVLEGKELEMRRREHDDLVRLNEALERKRKSA